MPITREHLLAIARLLLASLFIWEGVVQLRNPGDAARYFAGVGVPLPGTSVWISIVIHLLGGLALLIGLRTRCAAAVLLLLCLGTAFGVHLPAGDAGNMLHFYKNLAMAGGFLYVVVFGAGAISVDGGKPGRSGDRSTELGRLRIPRPRG